MLKNKSAFAALLKKKLEMLFAQLSGNRLRLTEWNAVVILRSKIPGTIDSMNENKYGQSS